MEIKEEQFILGLFRSYYSKCEAESLAPPKIARREFGLGSWVKKIESRHLSFATPADLKSYLLRNTPFYISFSSAYYEFPDRRPMPRKNWQAADLIFDLDADELDLSCLSSGEHAKGWVCDKCLSTVRDETLKLIEEFLVPDFGFSKSELNVNFSGNRGYHVHVRKDSVMQLTGWARKEIADYIAGTGLNPDSIFTYGKEHVETETGRTKMFESLKGPRPDSPGWQGRIARRFIQLVKEGKLEQAGIESALAKKITKNSESILEGISLGNWDRIKGLTLPQKTALAQKIIQSAAVNIEGFGASGGEVDAGVTFDVSKLIRLPGSIHGETGLAAKKLPANDLAKFDPMKDAVIFGNSPVVVKCSSVPKFHIANQEFGPFENQEATLPECAAVYLICKKRATLKRES